MESKEPDEANGVFAWEDDGGTPEPVEPVDTRLVSEREADTQQELEAAFKEVERLEQVTNDHPDSIASIQTGSKHDDTYYRRLPDIAGAKRLEQIHTNLPNYEQ